MTSTWQIFDTQALKNERSDTNLKVPEFHEFLKADSMHCGLYYLPAQSLDMQSPHDEDEIYYVIEGKAMIRIAGEEKIVRPGMMLYIQASEEHSFFEIEEDMTLLVVFA